MARWFTPCAHPAKGRSTGLPQFVEQERTASAYPRGFSSLCRHLWVFRQGFGGAYLENRPHCGWPPQDESSAAFKGTQGLNGHFVL